MEEKEYDEVCGFLDEISDFVAGNGGPCMYSLLNFRGSLPLPFVYIEIAGVDEVN